MYAKNVGIAREADLKTRAQQDFISLNIPNAALDIGHPCSGKSCGTDCLGKQKVMIKHFTQGRVFASSPDEAAMQIRDRHKEYDGGLTVLEAFKQLGWYEYTIELTTRDAMMTAIKDSGHRREFDTGAVRDMQEGKGRFDLVPPLALMRLARHYEAGAKKYGERNWEKGIPNSSFIDSAIRHMMQYLAGDRSEDHLAAAAFNVFGIMHFEEADNEQLPDAPTKTRRACRCADGQAGAAELRDV